MEDTNTIEEKSENKKMTMVDREVVLAKVDKAMSRGMQRPSEIAQAVGCSCPTAAEYVKAIRERWKLSKDHDIDFTRGEVIEKLRELEVAGWETYEAADNTSAKIGALRTIYDVQKYRIWLTGLSTVLESSSDK
jgi:hypothetical protein